MGTQISLCKVAGEIKKAACDQKVDVQQIAKVIMERYMLNKVERRIVNAFLEDMMSDRPDSKSEK